MINIFVSCPTWVAEEFREGLTGFLSFLDTHDLKPRTLGSTDYPTESPLDEVISIMDECEGTIILGYPQIYVLSGVIKESGKDDLLLPTEWNHIEATLAYIKKMPLLIIHHKGITRGVFEHGAIGKFIYEKDLLKQNWFLSENIKGALMKWKASIVQRQKEESGASAAISTPPSTTPGPISRRLDENVETVLLYLFQTSSLRERTRDTICRKLNCAKEAAKYCLDELQKEEMITWEFIPYSDSKVAAYSVISKGRKHVMTNKLIKI